MGQTLSCTCVFTAILKVWQHCCGRGIYSNQFEKCNLSISDGNLFASYPANILCMKVFGFWIHDAESVTLLESTERNLYSLLKIIFVCLTKHFFNLLPIQCHFAT